MAKGYVKEEQIGQSKPPQRLETQEPSNPPTPPPKKKSQRRRRLLIGCSITVVILVVLVVLVNIGMNKGLGEVNMWSVRASMKKYGFVQVSSGNVPIRDYKNGSYVFAIYKGEPIRYETYARKNRVGQVVEEQSYLFGNDYLAFAYFVRQRPDDNDDATGGTWPLTEPAFDVACGTSVEKKAEEVQEMAMSDWNARSPDERHKSGMAKHSATEGRFCITVRLWGNYCACWVTPIGFPYSSDDLTLFTNYLMINVD